MAQLPDAFGHTVHDFIELIVLGFKKQMSGVEIAALNVPMRLARFSVENEFVSQQMGQLFCHRFAVCFRDANIDVHAKILSLTC
jgi:hypothetical protein